MAFFRRDRDREPIVYLHSHLHSTVTIVGLQLLPSVVDTAKQIRCATCERPLPDGRALVRELKAELDELPIDANTCDVSHPLAHVGSRRIIDSLLASGYATYGALMDATDDELARVKYLGPSMVRWLREELQRAWEDKLEYAGVANVTVDALGTRHDRG